ncbi:MAG: hypothetical protein ABSA49_01620 [Rhizomicrobium sp.]|jgi:hypothetical protein
MTQLINRKTGRNRSFMIAGAMCGALLTGCIHAAPPMLSDRTAMISGRTTSGRSASDATEIVLVKAAAMTLDHGFRYFQIVGSDSVAPDRSGQALIRPGADVTIRVYREGEINPRATGIVDAEDIAEHNPTIIASLPSPASPSSVQPPSQTSQPAKSGMPAPHCTVYGCTW